uniref:CXXC-type zinc finger protein 1 n=1 Tax=Tetranychus urticae TaxID=32264 RepID=T1KQN6_TETUR
MSEDNAYCICRSSDISRFMICCDNCDEWYHGDCISITEQLAKTMTKFYCLICRDRNPSLKIQYHSVVLNTVASSPKPTSKHGTVRKKSPSPLRSNKVARHEDVTPSEERDCKDKDDDHQDETLRNKTDSCEKNNQKSEIKSRSSRREANTTPADNERTNEKTHRERKEEISEIDDGLGQCLRWIDINMGEDTSYCICRSSDTSRFMIGCDSCNEWYHGDCISITEQLAKTITKFYCLMCRDANPSLKIQYHKDSGSKSTSKQGTVRKKKQPTSKSNKTARFEDDASPEKMDFEDENDEEFDDDDDGDETFRIENELSEKNNRKSKPKSRPSRKKTNTTSSDNKRGSKKTHRQRERERDVYEVDDGLRQCYGPGCINIARRGSKYCSDNCGIKLATNRIIEILPERIRFWQSTPSSADVFSNRELDAIRTEGETAKRLLEELDGKQKELEAMIAEAKKLPPISEDEVDEETGDELMTYCVTCGHEVASRTALRHMERCFEHIAVSQKRSV